MFASALLTGGVGPWLPFQMLGAGWVGLVAGLLPARRPARARRAGAARGVRRGRRRPLRHDHEPAGLAVHRAGSSSSVAFVPGDPLSANLPRFLVYCLTTSLGWDLPRAALTVVLCLTLGAPVLRALRRATRRAAFAAPVAFVPPQPGPAQDSGGLPRP